MRYLKTFESSEPTIREKVERLVEIYNYLWDNHIEDPENLTGKLSVIFMAYAKPLPHSTFGNPYEFMIDKLITNLETKSYRREEKIGSINELYNKMKDIPKFDRTGRDIYSMMLPLIEAEVDGGKLFTNNYNIAYCYTYDFRYSKYIANYLLKLRIDEEYYDISPDQAHRLSNKDRAQYETMFYKYKLFITELIKDIDPAKYGFNYRLSNYSPDLYKIEIYFTSTKQTIL